MRHSIGDGLIVASLAALAFGYLYLKYRTRIKRLELIHQERLVAMDKDFPLPELPLDAPQPPAPFDPILPLTIGVVLAMFGIGSMIAIRGAMEGAAQRLWITPLPLVLIGVGLVFVVWLTRTGKV